MRSMSRLDDAISNVAYILDGGVSMKTLSKPTKEQFKDYVRIQRKGVTNMFCINNVINLSRTGLTTDICLYIMDHYDELREEYGV